MYWHIPHSKSRRALLRSIPASALLATVPVLVRAAAAALDKPPTRPEEVLNVMDFEALARAALPPAHFGYLATGVDGDETVAWNHDAFGQIEIRARRFVDVSHVDMSVDMLGVKWPTPVYLSAVGSQRAFHSDAEKGTARAAASRNALLMVSSGASIALEDIAASRAGPVWHQLYATDDWAVTQAVVKRALRAGCPAIILTVDNMPGRNNETLKRAMTVDERQCTQCHINNSHDTVHKAPIYSGLDLSRAKELSPSAMSWELLDRTRQIVPVKLLVKGIVTGEDADLCVRHGVDGIIVSNHGGRNEETLRATIECLPEVVTSVRGRTPVLLDGGIRRGTDVFKALALGATAVGIGRPQGWGLAAFGQAGVEAVLDIFSRELRAIMRQAGTTTISAVKRDSVIVRQRGAAFSLA
jgi:(S)-2-hydroxy-acid oxidase